MFFFSFSFTFVRDDMHTKLQREIEEITKSHFLQFNILFYDYKNDEMKNCTFSYLYPPQNEVLGGYTVFSLSVIP